jgi:hypothetical protein
VLKSFFTSHRNLFFAGCILWLWSAAYAYFAPVSTLALNEHEADIHFSAEPGRAFSPGGCVQLTWNVQNINGVYLNDVGTVGESSQPFCATFEHQPVFRVAFRDSSEESYAFPISFTLVEPLFFLPFLLGLICFYIVLEQQVKRWLIHFDISNRSWLRWRAWYAPGWLEVLLIISAIVLLVILSFTYLGHVPPTSMLMTVDEVTITDWGRTMYATGLSKSNLYGVVGSFHSILVPLQGPWYAAVGVSLLTARLYWYLLALPSILFTTLAARLYFGRAAALITLAVALLIPLNHGYTRFDLFVPTALSAGLYLLASGRKTGAYWRYYLAGIAFALCVEGHALAFRFPLVIGLLLAGVYGYRMIQARRPLWDGSFWAFVAGGVTYSIVYVYLHTFFYGLPLDTLTTGYAGNYNFEMTIGGNLNRTFIERVYPLFERWYGEYTVQYPFEAGLLVFGLLAGLVRRTYADKLLLSLFFLTMLIFFATLPKYNPAYWIHTMPILALLVGGGAAAILTADIKRSTWASLACAVVIAGLMTWQVTWIARTFVDVDEFIQTGYDIDALLPPDVEEVEGSLLYYYGLHSRTFKMLNLQPTQAFIDTRYEMIAPPPEFIEYIQRWHMVRVACFYVRSFNAEAHLYVLPEFERQITPQTSDCRLPAIDPVKADSGQ